MSYATAAAALKPLVAAVTGIRFVQHGRPMVVDNPPLVFLEPDNGDRTYAAQMVGAVYRVRVVVVVSRQGQTLAEDQIAPFINSLPIAIDADPTLGGAVTWAKVTSWITSYPEYTEKPTRSLEFICEITEKKNRGSV